MEEERDTAKSIAAVGSKGSIWVVDGHLKHTLSLADDEYSICSNAKVPIAELNHFGHYSLLILLRISILEGSMIG